MAMTGWMTKGANYQSTDSSVLRLPLLRLHRNLQQPLTAQQTSFELDSRRHSIHLIIRYRCRLTSKNDTPCSAATSLNAETDHVGIGRANSSSKILIRPASEVLPRYLLPSLPSTMPFYFTLFQPRLSLRFHRLPPAA